MTISELAEMDGEPASLWLQSATDEDIIDCLLDDDGAGLWDMKHDDLIEHALELYKNGVVGYLQMSRAEIETEVRDRVKEERE